MQFSTLFILKDITATETVLSYAFSFF